MAAIPYLRPRDLPGTRIDVEGQWSIDSVLEAHRSLVHAVFERARGSGPVVATGHCYMVGGQTSDDSERRIQVGYQAALPADIYPPDAAYVALGHLHRAQAVEDHPHIRYSGSPIPLSLSERSYRHQVVRVDLAADGTPDVRPLFVPRSRALKAIPEEPAPREEVVRQLSELPQWGPSPDALEPLIEARVRIDGPEPRLRAQIEAALEGVFGRLARLAVTRPAAPEAAPPRALESLKPDEVLSLLWSREKGGAVPAPALALFHELLETAEAERDGEV